MELARFSAELKSPGQLCLASTNQLKHYILAMRTNGSSASSLFSWHTALLYVANTCLPLVSPEAFKERADGHDLEPASVADAATRRLWYLACIDGYRALAPNFGAAANIANELLTMGVRDGLLSPADGEALQKKVDGSTSLLYDYKYREREADVTLLQEAHHLFQSEPRREPAAFVIDLNKATLVKRAAMLQAIIQSFDEMVMQE